MRDPSQGDGDNGERSQEPRRIANGERSQEPRRGVVVPLQRPLNAELRARLGLAVAKRTPYRWGFACLVVALACVPMLLAKMWLLSALSVVVGLVVLPLVRWFEQRDLSWREDVVRTGAEAIGRVLDVEPASQGKTDHLVRLEFPVGSGLVRTSVIGCPLAARGLAPDDEVVIYYARERPTRCVIARKAPLREVVVVDALFD
jgi:hypothetical protein